jgi:hypothetical protein
MPDSNQVMTNADFRSLKHPLQDRRFALALFFALILFPLIAALLTVGTAILLVPLFAFLFWMSARVYYAYYMGNSILVSELNYPRINSIAEELKARIGYAKPVNVFVYEQGNFNAVLVKFFFYRRAVFLNSELLEAGVTDDELRWLIGRFIGYLKARRLSGFWGWTIRSAQKLLVFNFFLLPYDRALNYSGDRVALAVIAGDITTAVSAMQKIFVGRQLGYSVNPSGMVDQHRRVKGSFFALMARIWMSFPHMTARYVDLIACARQRYPAQYARFEAENPGLPQDLPRLAALPNVSDTAHRGKEPVWLSLAGAIIVIALIIFASIAALEASGVHIPRPSWLENTGSGSAPIEDKSAGGSGYISSEGRFSAQFPGSPTEVTKQVPLSDGDTTLLHEIHYEDGGTPYLVMYDDYPPGYVDDGAQAVLKRVRDGLAKSMKARLTTDQAVELSGVPGRVFELHDKDLTTYEAADYLDGRRLYQIIVTVPSGSDNASAKDFVQSFRIR